MYRDVVYGLPGTYAMSALGQKQTFAVQNAMSALTPKADVCSATRYVRFVPIADINQNSAPFIIESGTGSELRQTLHYAIVGGLLVSPILSLHTTPVVYLAFSTDCAGVPQQ